MKKFIAILSLAIFASAVSVSAGEGKACEASKKACATKTVAEKGTCPASAKAAKNTCSSKKGKVQRAQATAKGGYRG